MSSTGASTSGLGDGDQLARNLAYLEGDEIGASEFNWGPGLEPQSVRGKPPSEGGRYRGTSPPCENNVRVSRNR
ncbi:hypothetical protein MINTM008_13640 [Mycobacterium intracellulare]|nr:hypothetical protein MINTM002_11190 [Mycobacterium intracellulare]BCO61277.1 hypothetical protein MINTM006_12270 [Mycobacterium intracellulare]BCO66476.1 hypothetical protein MINTM007_10870 [Mycobacterium intracellulare]BCO72029.1 hypothetical protein MINTM008_13640 [Mycobacterium intracellulare]BCO77475.1 hypothetical protein MINTM009_12570 [Mycobacterium intracellulare]